MESSNKGKFGKSALDLKPLGERFGSKNVINQIVNGSLIIIIYRLSTKG